MKFLHLIFNHLTCKVIVPTFSLCHQIYPSLSVCSQENTLKQICPQVFFIFISKLLILLRQSHTKN